MEERIGVKIGLLIPEQKKMVLLLKHLLGNNENAHAQLLAMEAHQNYVSSYVLHVSHLITISSKRLLQRR